MRECNHCMIPHTTHLLIFLHQTLYSHFNAHIFTLAPLYQYKILSTCYLFPIMSNLVFVRETLRATYIVPVSYQSQLWHCTLLGQFVRGTLFPLLYICRYGSSHRHFIYIYAHTLTWLFTYIYRLTDLCTALLTFAQLHKPSKSPMHLCRLVSILTSSKETPIHLFLYTILASPKFSSIQVPY